MVNKAFISLIALTLSLSFCASQPVSKLETSAEPKFFGLAALYGGILAAGLANNGGWNSGGGHQKPGHGHGGHGGHGNQGGNFLGQLTGGWGGCKRKC
ncbi:cold and drought-regulated protein CORA-like [Dendroctonus ponderosae]|uniref:Uncharacterized protein n=1 Tax=Dendroctonus ponderosae TaxID=77166 RepID=A0AAR5PBT2_DENPD|nr:cold and drought-regulated protein CORA-like [Dendroctonus ponderosae]KAH1016607.1 hypothetical protein HUJ04_007801 [Dendroctonus ponderosae]KAH1025976.1 hypothetical protein HUJ05_010576 [Dendroctonus ponderosae]